MDDIQFEELTTSGEGRSLDFKESVSWDEYKLKFTKTTLSMANIKDGGMIIIGVSEKNGKFTPEGIQERHLKTYNPDNIQAFFNSFADPYIRVDIRQWEYKGLKFLKFIIHEFDEIPVICKKGGGNGLLREGAIYTRSYRMPETCEVRSQTEMRNIINIAVGKGIKEFIRKADFAGIKIGRVEVTVKTDSEMFKEQLGSL